MNAKPVIATTIGDPCGIGTEVAVKAYATGEPHQLSRPLLIGSTRGVEMAIEVCNLDLDINKITSIEEAKFEHGTADVFDPDNLDPAEIVFSRESAAVGQAVCEWMDLARSMGERGEIDGWVMASIHAQSVKAAGRMDALDDLMPDNSWLLRINSPLRIVPVLEHTPISEISPLITHDAVLKLIRLLHKTIEKWGMPNPRIGVSGLNAHAEGIEDREQIKPAVEDAVAQGIDAEGPVSPDAVFRHCIEGKYDAIVSMYHDQGQIALKTAAFAGACSVFIGLPYIFIATPHGSAFDIAGQGIAQHMSTLAAMKMAASLAAGKGFIDAV